VKVAKLAKDFNIPTTTLTTVLKNKGKIICHFLLSKYIYLYVKPQFSQTAILIKECFQPLPGFGIEPESYFRSDLT